MDISRVGKFASIGIVIGLSATLMIGSSASAVAPHGTLRAKISAPTVSAAANTTSVLFTWTRGTNASASVKWELDITGVKPARTTVGTPRLNVNAQPGTSVTLRVRARVGSYRYALVAATRDPACAQLRLAAAAPLA